VIIKLELRQKVLSKFKIKKEKRSCFHLGNYMGVDEEEKIGAQDHSNFLSLNKKGKRSSASSTSVSRL